nr:MAG TPA: hypothetical protein [Caudoviricetes sp.]
MLCSPPRRLRKSLQPTASIPLVPNFRKRKLASKFSMPVLQLFYEFLWVEFLSEQKIAN